MSLNNCKATVDGEVAFKEGEGDMLIFEDPK
jgi:hypothetical protein